MARARAQIIELTAQRGPMTAKQIAFEMDLHDSTVRTCIQRARSYGTQFLRIAGWIGFVPMYGPGPGEDVDPPGIQAQILEWLRQGNVGHSAKMAKELGLTTDAIHGALVRLRKKNYALPPRRRFMHIAGWFRPVGQLGGREAAMFKAGPGEDVPKPDFSNLQAVYERRYHQKRAVMKRAEIKQRKRISAARSAPVGNVFAALMPQMGA